MTDRIELLHRLDLLLLHLRKMTDEVHELPVVGIAAAPSRHAGEAHAVANDREKLAVAELLRLRQRHVGRMRIKVFADLGVAAAIVAVTLRAVIAEMLARLGENVGRER